MTYKKDNSKYIGHIPDSIQLAEKLADKMLGRMNFLKQKPTLSKSELSEHKKIREALNHLKQKGSHI